MFGSVFEFGPQFRFLTTISSFSIDFTISFAKKVEISIFAKKSILDENFYFKKA